MLGPELDPDLFISNLSLMLEVGSPFRSLLQSTALEVMRVCSKEGLTVDRVGEKRGIVRETMEVALGSDWIEGRSQNQDPVSGRAMVSFRKESRLGKYGQFSSACLLMPGLVFCHPYVEFNFQKLCQKLSLMFH